MKRIASGFPYVRFPGEVFVFFGSVILSHVAVVISAAITVPVSPAAISPSVGLRTIFPGAEHPNAPQADSTVMKEPARNTTGIASSAHPSDQFLELSFMGLGVHGAGGSIGRGLGAEGLGRVSPVHCCPSHSTRNLLSFSSTYQPGSSIILHLSRSPSYLRVTFIGFKL